MRLQVFSVRDNAVGAFLPPFYVRARGEAVRSFMEAVGDPQHQFAKNPDDYVMYFLGEFDDNAGMFIGGEPTRIIGALECFGPDRVTAGRAAAAGNGADKRAT